MRKKFYIKDINQIQDGSMSNIPALKTQTCELSQAYPQMLRNSHRQKEKSMFTQNSSQNHLTMLKNILDSQGNIKNNNIVKINQKWQSLRRLKNFTQKRKNKQAQQNRKTLQKIISKHKINNVVGTVAEKLSRNLNKFYKSVEQKQSQPSQQNFLDRNGLSLNIYQQVIYTMVSAFSFLLLICLLSIYIICKEPSQYYQQTIFKIIIFVLLFLLVILNFAVIRKFQGKTICKIRQIGKIYLKQAFFEDLIVLIVLLFDIFSTFYPLKYIRFLYMIKLRSFKKDVSKLDYIFVNNFYKEQYWNLFRLVIGNFYLAHFFSLILLVMTDLSVAQQESNWLIKAKLNTRSDFQKYIWSYYWSVTTMLTVGFGDLTPANYKQAICLIFIQFISSILLAYTISCVGQLLLNLRNMNLEKRKNLKILKQIVQNNLVSRTVQEKVGNYIEQAIQAKKQANFEQQKNFINDLPPDVRSDLVRQCNFKLFNNIPIIKNFTIKIIQQLAQKIQLSISHPQEILLNNKSPWSVNILKQGHIGYFATPSKLNYRYLMNQLKIDSKQKSQIICMNFIPKQRINYEIKSITYSKMYSIQQQQFKNIIKKYKKDFEQFLQERDKAKIIIDQYQVLQCNSCKGRKHTKASCPCLHFIPYKNMVIFKYQQKQKNEKNERSAFLRNKMLGWQTKDNLVNSFSNSQSHSYKTQNKNNLIHAYKVFPEIKSNPVSNMNLTMTQQNLTSDNLKLPEQIMLKNLILNPGQQILGKTVQEHISSCLLNSKKYQKYKIEQQNKNNYAKDNFDLQKFDYIKQGQFCAENNKFQTLKQQNLYKVFQNSKNFENIQNQMLQFKVLSNLKRCPSSKISKFSSIQNMSFLNKLKEFNDQNQRKSSVKVIKTQSHPPPKEQMIQYFLNQYRERNNIFEQDKKRIQCDELFDFENYFTQKNPRYLKNKPLNGKHCSKKSKKVAFMQVQLE